jgi:hypothetical protein
LFLAAALPRIGAIVRAARLVLIVAGALTMISLAALALYYGRDLGYRFEVLAIGVDWLTLIVVGVMLALGFRHDAIAPAASP